MTRNELLITPETHPFQPSFFEFLVFDRFYGFNGVSISVVGRGNVSGAWVWFWYGSMRGHWVLCGIWWWRRSNLVRWKGVGGRISSMETRGFLVS